MLVKVVIKISIKFMLIMKMSRLVSSMQLLKMEINLSLF